VICSYLNVLRPPPGFAKAVKTYRDSVKKAYKSKADGANDQKKIKFTQKWKDYKAIFAEAQHGKCSYCEIMVIDGQPGDVEHYWPKGEVWRLKDDPNTLGQERN